MKTSKIRLFTVFMIFMLVLSCLSCSPDKNEPDAIEPNPVESGTIEPDASDSDVTEPDASDSDVTESDVTFTFPAYWFEGREPEEVIKSAEGQGVTAVYNEDGSYTCTMPYQAHKELMDNIKTSLVELRVRTATPDFGSSIEKFEYNDDYTQFSVFVDSEYYEDNLADPVVIDSLGRCGMIYQIYNGNADGLKITVDVKDSKTNELIESFVFPETISD